MNNRLDVLQLSGGLQIQRFHSSFLLFLFIVARYCDALRYWFAQAASSLATASASHFTPAALKFT
jgi:hypothetical protein